MFQPKSASYYASSVISCEVHTRSPSTIKVLVHRDRQRDTKRYDFEAEDKQTAEEIVAEINKLRLRLPS